MGTQRTISDEVFARYVLGELSDAEKEIVEEAYFLDPSVHERLMSVEDEIFDAYAQGDLNEQQRKHFEALHLRSRSDRDKLAFSQALSQVIHPAHSAALPEKKAAGNARTARVRELLAALWNCTGSQSFRFAFPVAVAAILLIAVMVPLTMRRREVPAINVVSGPQQVKQAALPRQLAKDVRDTASAPPLNLPSRQEHVAKREILPVFAFSLIPTARDSSSGTNTFRIPTTPATIRLNITLSGLDYSRYRVSVQKPDGQSINLPARVAVNQSTTVYVDIASNLLKAGDYVLDLQGLTPNQTSEDIAGYSFRIERGR